MKALSESIRMTSAFEASQRRLIEEVESSPVTRDVIERALEAMWRGPEPPFSAWRKPNWGPLSRSLPMTAEMERSAWQRAGHSAWIESVRAKLQSAVYATNLGWSWTWGAPGVYGRPDLPERMQVRAYGSPAYLPATHHREDEDYHRAH